MGESYRIAISRNLVRQLAGDDEMFKKKTRKPRAKRPREPQQARTKVHQEPISDQAPLFQPIILPPQLAYKEIDAIRSVLQDSEKVLARLQKQEDDMAREVTQRAKDLHEKEFKLPQQKPMLCLAEKNACLDCYKENIKNPLNCANLVNKLAYCARAARQRAH